MCKLVKHIVLSQVWKHIRETMLPSTTRSVTPLNQSKEASPDGHETTTAAEQVQQDHYTNMTGTHLKADDDNTILPIIK